MKNNLYFPNLNGLRFIAAAMVFFPHIEQVKGELGLEANFSFYLHPDLGKLGVILFFTLSGFLITYLLIKEKAETGTISIKQFFIRRELRIAPLYYLLIAISFFILPSLTFFNIPIDTGQLSSSFSAKLLLYLLFAPNIALTLYPPIPFISQAWSIGVEEQFYFAWAILAKKINSFFNMLLGIIIFYLIVRCGLIFIQYFFLPNSSAVKYLSAFWRLFNIDCMAIGGLAAFFLFYDKQKLLGFLFNIYTQIFVYLLLVLLIIVGFQIPFFTYECFSIIFGIIIVNLAGNKNNILKLENKVLTYLGKISYGIYMYHIIAIVIAIKLSAYFLLNNVFIYLVSFTLTILMSSLSYEYFEKRFIRAKIKYSKIVSGDNVKHSET